MLDFVILTEDRYEKPKNINWYIKNVLNEDSILLNEIANLGFSVKRISWSSKSFDWSNVKYVIFRTTWDYFEKLNDFRLWMKKTSKKTKFINPYSQILWNLDKVYLNDFKNQGINIVPSFFVNQKCSLNEIVNYTKWENVVVKPTISAAAWNTHLVLKQDLSLFEPTFRDLQKNHNLLVQEFQKNILSRGEFSLMVIGGKYTHAVIKRVKKGDYRVQDDYGGSVERYNAPNEMVGFAESIISKCDPTPFYARVDIIIDNNNELALSELELIEPELWFRFCPESAHLLAKEVTRGY